MYSRQPHGFKTCLLGRSFYTFIRNVLFRFIPLCIAVSFSVGKRLLYIYKKCFVLLYPIMYRCQPHGFKTRLLRRGFYTLVRNVLFPPLTKVESRHSSFFLLFFHIPKCVKFFLKSINFMWGFRRDPLSLFVS